MFSQLFFLFLLPVLSFSLALPAPPGSKTYHLRNSAGLYLSSYHVAAGISDAVFVPDVENASTGFLDGTSQMFAIQSELSWGLVLAPQPYTEWSTVRMMAGSSSAGFSINEGQLVWHGDRGFGGWLVCDWWHGVPQLFWINNPNDASAFPSSCSRTDLRVEYI